MKKKTISITKEQLSKVMHNCISTASDNFIERKEKNNVLDEVPTHMNKLSKKAWCVIYQTTDVHHNHEYHIKRNVFARTPEQASKRGLDQWSKNNTTSLKDSLVINIIYIGEDDGNINK